MSENGYNGYTNWETWNVALWIDNTEHLYDLKWEYLTHLKGNVTANDVKSFVESFMNGTTPDFDGDDTHKGDDIDRVDWEQIAESWAGDWQEEQDYRGS